MPTLSLDKVIEFLRCFPCLEKLYIQCDTPRKNKVGSRKHWDLIGHHDIRLKTVVLNYYPGRKSPIDFVWFFILNSRLLESMTIVVKTDTEKLLAKKHWNQQIENMASKGAQFDFTTQSRHKFGDIKYVHDLDPNYPFEWLF
uniref:Uncharacterized protein n=1 Tax=Avena sativa TaxID=4498 RepID=A0ACD5W4C6_AVESA